MNKKFLFKREDGKFDDILNDKSIKKNIIMKMTWANHMLLEICDPDDTGLHGYIILKYGDFMTNFTHKDFTPVIGVDYSPGKRN